MNHTEIFGWRGYPHLFGFVLVLCGFFALADASACPACGSPAERTISPEMQRLIDTQRSAADIETMKNDACPEWWAAKYPDTDEHTMANLVRFHALMIERATFGQRLRDSMQVVRQAHLTGGPEAHERTPTGQAYLQATAALDRALDAHPAVAPYKEQLEGVQEERQAVASRQAEVLEAWQLERRDRYALFNQAIELAMATYTQDLAALRSRAGVAPREPLPEAFQEEADAIENTRREAFAFARETMQRMRDPETIAEARMEDGSQLRFDAANERYAELDEEQERIRADMAATRNRLRSSDPDILKYVAAVQVASRAHLEAVESREDVHAAKALVAERDEIQAKLDREARVLRHNILSLHPQKEAVLDVLAAIGDFGHVPDGDWNLQE